MATVMTAANLGFASSLGTKTVGASRSEISGAADAFAKLTTGSRCPEGSSRQTTVVVPVAKRVCDLTGKKRNNGNKVSFSNHRTKHVQEANLQYKRIWWEQGKRFVRLKLSTKALKTIEWKGIDKMAKEAGVDLSKF